VKVFKPLAYLLIISLLVTPACILEVEDGGGGSYTQWKYEIKQVIYSIYEGYNNRNIFQIMEHFSQDFMHNTMNYNDEESLWYDRFDQDYTANVYNIDIEIINDAYAKTSYYLQLNGNTYNVNSFSEFYSDVTIFRRENGYWRVYGNQNPGWQYYDINVDSYPEGARIYIDGNYTGQNTPATIEDISPGQYTLGVYLRGYNEISETIYLDEDIYKNYDLQTPSEPKPDINITSPENGETFNDTEFLLNGYINNFDGNEAILTYNGIEYSIEVDSFNDFRVYVNLNQYENTFFIRATNNQGNTGTTVDYTIYREF